MPGKATVVDEHLKGAFQEGMAEGVEHWGAEEEYVLVFLFEGTKLNESKFPVDPVSQSYMLGEAQKHLETAVGASVLIERRWKAVPAVEAPSDDEVVDAEIVD